jgi:hypothetical protein
MKKIEIPGKTHKIAYIQTHAIYIHILSFDLLIYLNNVQLNETNNTALIFLFYVPYIHEYLKIIAKGGGNKASSLCFSKKLNTKLK